MIGEIVYASVSGTFSIVGGFLLVALIIDRIERILKYGRDTWNKFSNR